MSISRSGKDVVDEISRLISAWQNLPDRDVSVDDISKVNTLSAELASGNRKKERKVVRQKLLDVMAARQAWYKQSLANTSDDQYLETLHHHMEELRKFCLALKKLDLVQGKGSGEDGRKSVMVMIDKTLIYITKQLDRPLAEIFCDNITHGREREVRLTLVALQGQSELTNVLNCHESEKGETPLILAVKTGNAKMVKTLLQVPGIKVNATASHPPFKTALQEAMRLGNNEIVKVIEIVKAIMAHPDCDLFYKDYHGETALDYAYHFYKRGVAEVLEKAMTEQETGAYAAVLQQLEKLKKSNGDLKPESLREIVQVINENTPRLTRGQCKEKRAHIRNEITRIFEGRWNPLFSDDKADRDQVENEINLLCLLKNELKIIQGKGSASNETKSSMHHISNWIDDLRRKVAPLAAGDIDTPVDAVLWLAYVNSHTPAVWADLLDKFLLSDNEQTRTNIRSLMKTMYVMQSWRVKSRIYQTIEEAANANYGSDLNEDDWLSRLAQAKNRKSGNVLFDILRMDNAGTADQDTELWKKFVNLMEKKSKFSKTNAGLGDRQMSTLFSTHSKQGEGESSEEELLPGSPSPKKK